MFTSWSQRRYVYNTSSLRHDSNTPIRRLRYAITSPTLTKIPWIQHASNEQILGMVDDSLPCWKQGKKNTWKTTRATLLDAMMQEDEENENIRKAEKDTWQRNLASLRKDLPLRRTHNEWVPRSSWPYSCTIHESLQTIWLHEPQPACDKELGRTALVRVRILVVLLLWSRLDTHISHKRW